MSNNFGTLGLCDQNHDNEQELKEDLNAFIKDALQLARGQSDKGQIKKIETLSEYEQNNSHYEKYDQQNSEVNFTTEERKDTFDQEGSSPYQEYYIDDSPNRTLQIPQTQQPFAGDDLEYRIKPVFAQVQYEYNLKKGKSKKRESFSPQKANNSQLMGNEQIHQYNKSQDKFAGGKLNTQKQISNALTKSTDNVAKQFLRDAKSEDRSFNKIANYTPVRAEKQKKSVKSTRYSSVGKNRKSLNQHANKKQNEDLLEIDTSVEQQKLKTKTPKEQMKIDMTSSQNEQFIDEIETPIQDKNEIDSQQLDDHQSKIDKILTPQPKSSIHKKKSSQSNLKSPKPPIPNKDSPYKQQFLPMKPTNFNEDILSTQSNKTMMNNYDYHGLTQMQQPTGDAQSVIQMNENSNIGGLNTFLNKYELGSVSTHSIMSKEFIQKQSIHEKNQAVIKKFSKTPSRKKMMNQAINALICGHLEEFVRIKKPMKQASIIGKLFCMLIVSFRNANIETYSYEQLEEQFEKWENIQNFTCNNQIKVIQECVGIKLKAQNRSCFNLNYITKMIERVGENESHLKNITNKSLKSIFDVIQRALIYIEYKHIKNACKKSFLSPTQSNQQQTENARYDHLSQPTFTQYDLENQSAIPQIDNGQITDEEIEFIAKTSNHTVNEAEQQEQIQKEVQKQDIKFQNSPSPSKSKVRLMQRVPSKPKQMTQNNISNSHSKNSTYKQSFTSTLNTKTSVLQSSQNIKNQESPPKNIEIQFKINLSNDKKNISEKKPSLKNDNDSMKQKKYSAVNNASLNTVNKTHISQSSNQTQQTQETQKSLAKSTANQKSTKQLKTEFNIQAQLIPAIKKYKTPRSNSNQIKFEQYEQIQNIINQKIQDRMQLNQDLEDFGNNKNSFQNKEKTSNKRSKELSPTARLIQFKNKTVINKIIQNSQDNFSQQILSPNSTNNSNPSKSQQDLLLDLQIFQDKILKKDSYSTANFASPQSITQQQQFQQQQVIYRKLSTPKEYQIESNDNNDMFSIDNKVSESSSHQYEEEKYDIVNPILLFQKSSIYDNDDDLDCFRIKLNKVQEFKDQEKKLEEAQKYLGMQFEEPSSKKIDMSTIEELKLKRLQSRETGASLALRRDDTIKKIQKEMNLDSSRGSSQSRSQRDN